MNIIFSVVGLVILFFILTAGGDVLVMQSMMPDALLPVYEALLTVRNWLLELYAYLIGLMS